MKKYFVRTLYLIAIIELGIVSLLAFKQNPAIKNTMVLATTIKPEAFTELYFENHTKLPHSVTSSTPATFTFTIHNLENRDMKYHYTTYADLGNEKIVIDEGMVTLKHNAYKSLTERFTTDHLFGRMKIIVALTNKQQQINFWVEGNEPNAKKL